MRRRWEFLVEQRHCPRGITTGRTGHAMRGLTHRIYEGRETCIMLDAVVAS